MDENTQGNFRGDRSTRTPNKRGLGDQDETNPLLAISRFSRALAPYYLAIGFILSSIGSMYTVYYKMSVAQEKKDVLFMQAVEKKIKDATDIPFYQLSESRNTILDHEQRLRNIEASKRR